MEVVVNAIGDLEEGRGGNDGEERRRLERVTVRRGGDWRGRERPAYLRNLAFTPRALGN